MIINTRPCDSQQKKRTSRIVDLAVPANNRGKIKESGKSIMYQDIAREQRKNSMEPVGDCDTNCNWYTRNNLQRFGKLCG